MTDDPGAPADGGCRTRLLAWSGVDERDWRRAGEVLRRQLAEAGPAAFRSGADVGLPAGPAGPVRGAVLATDLDAATTGLRDARPHRARGRPVALLFPGQGAQHAGMAVGLYRRRGAFAEEMDALLGLFGPEVADDWLAARPEVDIDDVRRAQPLLFAIDRALGLLVHRWGVRPAALLGHSVGEIAAASLAGVFDATAAAALMRDRIDRLVDEPPGGMLAVAAGVEDVRPFLEATGDVAVGAVNAPRQIMVAGLDRPLDAVERALRAAGFGCRRARATAAFHSPVIEGALAGSSDLVATLGLRPPASALHSGYTGGLLDPATATDPAFWAAQPARPVLFGAALDELLGTVDHLLVEAGPGESLATLARRHPAVRTGGSTVVALLPPAPGGPDGDRRAVLSVAAALWLDGHDLDPTAVDAT